MQTVSNFVTELTPANLDSVLNIKEVQSEDFCIWQLRMLRNEPFSIKFHTTEERASADISATWQNTKGNGVFKFNTSAGPFSRFNLVLNTLWVTYPRASWLKCFELWARFSLCHSLSVVSKCPRTGTYFHSCAIYARTCWSLRNITKLTSIIQISTMTLSLAMK